MRAERDFSILLQDVWFELRGSVILRGIDWQVFAGQRWVHLDLRTMIPEFMSVLDVVLAGQKGALAFYEEYTPAERRRAHESLSHIRADHLISRGFSTLSNGERQRVLIARALMAEPEILLLDEPCMGLDPLSREEFLDSLYNLFAEKSAMTVITVTHHVEEITSAYEGVLILDGGRVLACGLPGADPDRGSDLEFIRSSLSLDLRG